MIMEMCVFKHEPFCRGRMHDGTTCSCGCYTISIFEFAVGQHVMFIIYCTFS